MDLYDHRNGRSSRINDSCYSFRPKLHMASNSCYVDWSEYAQARYNRKDNQEATMTLIEINNQEAKSNTQLLEEMNEWAKANIKGEYVIVLNPKLREGEDIRITKSPY